MPATLRQTAEGIYRRGKLVGMRQIDNHAGCLECAWQGKARKPIKAGEAEALADAAEHNTAEHPAPDALTWSRQRNDLGQLVRVYDSTVGVYTIDGNGAGRMRWTVTYPDGESGFTDTLREAVAWAEIHYARRTGTAPELGA